MNYQAYDSSAFQVWKAWWTLALRQKYSKVHGWKMVLLAPSSFFLKSSIHATERKELQWSVECWWDKVGKYLLVQSTE